MTSNVAPGEDAPRAGFSTTAIPRLRDVPLLRLSEENGVLRRIVPVADAAKPAVAAFDASL